MAICPKQVADVCNLTGRCSRLMEDWGCCTGFWMTIKLETTEAASHIAGRSTDRSQIACLKNNVYTVVPHSTMPVKLIIYVDSVISLSKMTLLTSRYIVRSPLFLSTSSSGFRNELQVASAASAAEARSCGNLPSPLNGFKPSRRASDSCSQARSALNDSLWCLVTDCGLLNVACDVERCLRL